MKKETSSILLLLPLLLMPFASNITQNAEVTQTSTVRVPGNYTTIQAAVNAVAEGGTVLVDTGTYNEHIIVRKALTLLGAGKQLSIIDGGGSGIVITVEATQGVKISRFTIQNAGNIECIWLNYTSATEIVDTVLTKGLYGVALEYSNNNIISNNVISNNTFGIGMFSSNNNVIRDNSVYLSRNAGVDFETSDHNTVTENTLSNNGDGLSLYNSNQNAVYRNNFLNSTETQASVYGGFDNSWDNGAEGNHWSDYSGSDTNGDGIGDTPYIIDPATSDSYPLIERWSLSRSFYVGTSEEGTDYSVIVAANSTVASFQFDQNLKQMSFNVTGPQGSTRFCNVTIPKPVLLGDPWTIIVDNINVSATTTFNENSTHTSIYFTVTRSKVAVRIIGTLIPLTQLKIHNIVIVSITFSSSEITAGENASVSVTVKNEGNFTENFDVTVLYDTKTIETQTVASLAPGETKNLSFTWNTTAVASGEYYLKATALTTVNETNTLDNTLTTTSTILVLIHNVAVISVTPLQTRAEIGQDIRISVIVKNEGNFAESFSVSTYRNDTTLGPSQYVSNLAANTTRDLTFVWPTKGTVEGTYVITAKAQVVPGETEEADNTLASATKVTIIEPQATLPTEAIVFGSISAVVVFGVVLYWRLKRRTPEATEPTKSKEGRTRVKILSNGNQKARPMLKSVMDIYRFLHSLRTIAARHFFREYYSTNHKYL